MNLAKLALLVLLTVSSAARADEGTPYYPRAATAHLGSVANATNGLFLIGDSISVWTRGAYESRANTVKSHLWLQAQSGWNIFGHLNTPTTAADSFKEAARSTAKAVVVFLGWNDIACLDWSPACFRAPPPADVPAHLFYTAALIQTASKELLDAGKCVIWVGPRELDVADWGVQASYGRGFNQALRNLQQANPGRFFAASYDAIINASPALKKVLDGPGGDHIHPVSATDPQLSLSAQNAIAQAVFYGAAINCGLHN